MVAKKPYDNSRRTGSYIRRHARRHWSRTGELLNRLYQDAKQDNAPHSVVMDAFHAYAEILPFLSPKLQAIAPATLDAEGNISPAMFRAIIEQVPVAAQMLPPSEEPEDTCRLIEAKTPDDTAIANE